MAFIEKVEAFIKVAEAMTNGEEGRAIRMGQIIEKAIDKEIRENSYYSKFDLRKDEKKIFAR